VKVSEEMPQGQQAVEGVFTIDWVVGPAPVKAADTSTSLLA